ncbi:MAG: hydroxyacylglutathione hydrolase [Magnetococcales bacterium]|nr:hydroxyacylglutathione hydrolase [Magnetococcales bacterium]
MSHPRLPTTPVDALGDNYIWLFPTGPGQVGAVDPGAAQPVLEHLQEQNLTLSHILLTHHHNDHTGGVARLKQESPARIIGSETDRHRLPPLDQPVTDGQNIDLGQQTAQVFSVPGHTIGHVAYLIEDCLFVGDTIFSHGCGRMFEGNPKMMWDSLKKLRDLKEAQWLFPAHEYTETNLRFTLELGGETREIEKHLAQVETQSRNLEPTLPTPMARERRSNPFLRCDDPQFARHLNLAGQPPEAVFAFLREKRNHF